MTTTWETLRARLDEVKPATAVFRLCPDPEIRDAYLKARTEAEQARRRADDAQRALDAADDTNRDAAARRHVTAQQAAKDADTALKKAKATYERESIPLTFRSIGREAVDDLRKEHPPREEDQADGLDWHFATFAPALISAASVDGMPVEDAARYLSEWTDPDAARLWSTAWGVQQTVRADVGKG